MYLSVFLTVFYLSSIFIFNSLIHLGYRNEFFLPIVLFFYLRSRRAFQIYLSLKISNRISCIENSTFLTISSAVLI